MQLSMLNLRGYCCICRVLRQFNAALFFYSGFFRRFHKVKTSVKQSPSGEIYCFYINPGSNSQVEYHVAFVFIYDQTTKQGVKMSAGTLYKGFVGSLIGTPFNMSAYWKN